MCVCMRACGCVCVRVCVFSKISTKVRMELWSRGEDLAIVSVLFFFFFLNGAQRFPGPSGGEAVAAETKPSDGCLTKAAARCSHGEHRPSLIFRYF